MLEISLSAHFFRPFNKFPFVLFDFHRFDAFAVSSDSLTYNLTEFNATVGLYFETIGNLQMYSRHGTFILNANLTYFHAEEKYFEQTVDDLQKFCDKIGEYSVEHNSSSNCTITMEILHSSLKVIQEQSINNIWFTSSNNNNNKKSAAPTNQQLSRLRRKKRELSTTFAKLLFGTSSNGGGAEQINILKLQTVENLLHIDKQTALFEGLLDVVNNTVQFQSGLHATLQTNFGNLTNWLNNATNQTAAALESNELYTKFVELSFIIMFSILEFRENQRKLIEAITTKSSIFQLISPKMFEMKLNDLSAAMAGNGLQLPMPLKRDNLPKFYEITSIDREIINNTFVIRFSVPFVENKLFVLHKVISVPHFNRSSEAFDLIVPRHEFIGIDALNATFVTLSGEDVKRCYRINSTNLLCYLNSPITMTHSTLSCEINLLLGKNFTSNCEVRNEHFGAEIWWKLEQPNTFLFSLPKRSPIFIHCPHSNGTIYLKHSGIISVKSGCRIRTNQVELITFHSIESNISHNFTAVTMPKVNVSMQFANVTEIKITSIPNFQLPRNTSDTDWIKVEEIRHNLRAEIGTAIEMAENILNSVVNPGKSVNNIVLSLAAIVIAIAVIYACVKFSLTTGISVLVIIVFIGLTVTTVAYFV